MVLYCLAYYSICRFCNVFRRIFGLFLHVEMLIAFSRRLVLCTKLCSSLPPPSLSFWNCSKITRECLKERGGKKKGFRTHRLNDGFYLVSVCWAWDGCVGLLCRFLWWKTQAMPDLTSTRKKKRKKEACAGMRRGGSGGGVARETRFQELRGCGITVSKTRQTKVYVQ